MGAGSASKERNWGVDLLRVVSMVMVAILHVLRQGGVLRSVAPLSISYEAAWALEIAAYCAVDCFALVSGYVGYGGRHRCSGIVSLVLQAVFYTAGWTIAFLVFRPSAVSVGTVVKAFLPFVDSYWYLRSYLCLFFVMPFLDALVRSIGDREVRGLAFTLASVFSVLPTVLGLLFADPVFGETNYDIASTSGGFSAAWLCVLYLLGACMRRMGGLRMRKSRCVAAYAGCVALTWLWKLMIEQLAAQVGIADVAAGRLISYTSPTILGCAVALLALFSQLDLGRRATAFARFFAPLAFGAYLFHTEPLVWYELLKDAFVPLVSLSAPLLVVAVLAASLLIWLVGSLVDWVRVRLFGLLHVGDLCDRVGVRMDRLLLRDPGLG